MSITFTYVASDGAVEYHGIPCRCDVRDEPIPVDDYDAPIVDPEHVGVCEHKRHELNLANSNGLALLKALGLPTEYVGTADPLVVLDALSRPACRNQPRHYLTRMRDLCADAVQRHVMIGWS